MDTPLVLMLAYDGSKFHGFAKQPRVTTIEEILLKTFRINKIQYLSRTDAGVSALSQLIFLPNYKISDLISIASKLPPCMIIHKIGKIFRSTDLTRTCKFRRLIKSKEYIYVSPYMGENLKRLEFACTYLNTSRRNYRLLVKNPKRYDNEKLNMKLNVRFEKNGNFLIFYVEGKYFLWEQVRRLVTLLKAYALGFITQEAFIDVFRGIPIKTGISPAPPQGLALWRVKTKEIYFQEILPEKIIKKWLLSRLKHYTLLSINSWVFPKVKDTMLFKWAKGLKS